VSIPQNLGKVHFVGIGGSGMSGIAHMFLDAGIEVSGSDREESPYLPPFRDRGVDVRVGHDAANVGDAETLVVTSALWPDNPELVRAQEQGIPILHRSQALHFLSRGKRVVTVAGAHGKTTSTGMIVTMMRELGADPSFVNGGVIQSLKASSGTGVDNVFVLEADESDGSFLLYDTAIALVTNVDADHLDHFGTQEKFEDAFVAFATGASELIVASGDGDQIRSVLARVHGKTVTTFGEAADVDMRVDNIIATDHVTFDVHWKGVVHSARVNVSGRHNAVNATGALAVLVGMGYDLDLAIAALEQFGGTKRRFELKGIRRGVAVYDDYAHNPAEAAAAVAGARTVVGKGRVIAVHQPHLWTRTQQRSAEFAAVYEALADYTVVLAVDGAREDPIPGVSGQLVVDAFEDKNKVIHKPDWQDAADEVARVAREGDIVMTLSCGDVYKIIPQLIDALENSVEEAESNLR
ncbi:MAG: UDP-N-acetylmuramate--L-alanine ligase, partial [Rhodoglobus sp.]